MANPKHVRVVSKNQRKRVDTQKKPELRRLAGRDTEPAPGAAEQIASPALQAHNDIESLPPAVVNGRIAVNYLKPHFEYDAKLDKRTVAIELSLELRDEHKTHVPREVVTWWDAVKSGGVKSMSLLGIPMQHVELGLAPEGDDRDLTLEAADVSKVSLSVIEQTGNGESHEAIRLQFRVMAELDREVERFACNQYGKVLWLRMDALQGSLL